MNSFDIALQVEDVMTSNEEDFIRLMEMNENVYDGIDTLAKYGEQVGFNSVEFSAACEEAIVNATSDVVKALDYQRIFDVEDFISFVIGFAYAKRYFHLF